MESSEFAFYFSNFPTLLKLFDGVYSFDKIPTQIKLHHFIICNTDISSGSGKHWFCVFRSNKKFLECFDSLGFDDTKKQSLINACTFKNISEIKINSTPVQLSTSDTCGKFCVMFIVERLHNPDMTFDELMNEIFSDDCEANEKILQQFFEEIIDGSQ